MQPDADTLPKARATVTALRHAAVVALAAMALALLPRPGLAAQPATASSHPPAVERPVAFVTVGKPSEPAQKVIDYLRGRK